MPTIVTRGQWDADPAEGPNAGRTIVVPAPEVFIHHTVGGAPTTVAGEKAEMHNLQEIGKCKARAAGWNTIDISYNFVVFPSGRIYEGRGWGKYGIHTEDWNHLGHSISHAGNYETRVPTAAQLDSTRWLIAEGKRLKKVKTTVRIRGHRDVRATACPGRNLYARLSYIKTPWATEPTVPTYPSYRVTHANGSSGVFKPPGPGVSIFETAWARARQILVEDGEDFVSVERL